MSPHAPRLRSLIRLLVTVLIGLLSACSRTSGPTVVAGNARFEFLTPWLVRMEYARSGAFVDAPTAVVEKRDWPEVRVQTTRKDGWLVASTADVRIRYKLESGE